MKCNLLRTLWLVICALVLGADARANENEVAIADSIQKYKYYAKTARQNKEYDRGHRLLHDCFAIIVPQDLKAAYFLGQLYYEKKDSHRRTHRTAPGTRCTEPSDQRRLAASEF